ncbi:endo-1,4-beta-xylanase [Paenibacillus endophyticus]|uniref:Beta-xylanase n=1 Tax=Paenibacillus endophyticus TaxID=1294268 RepID=A0A7W5C3Z8_9BACL|nr:endo-1,4-beta-xylanase [Paenibacillus endophyticus]MBB3150457.1 endo-1,4-beta-xylanase [Paenibacillus endophyticus]
MKQANKTIVYIMVSGIVWMLVVSLLIMNNYKSKSLIQENTWNETIDQQAESPSDSIDVSNEEDQADGGVETNTEELGETATQLLEPSVEADLPSLAKAFADYFPIGAAIEPSHTSGLKAELLKKHVNMLVAENVMKPDAIQPTEGNFTWGNADQLVAFAKQNGMEVRFHTLVWHSQVGAWFFKDSEGKPMIDETDLAKREVNKKLLLKRLDTHVRTIVGRYKDDIKSWDVVNEVIEPADPDGIRASDWYKISGTAYIETAFRAAREAGGLDAKLYINDYGTDNPAKRDRLYELIKEMLGKGVPIDGVGHQTHIGIYGPDIADIIESMQKYSELGLDNLVTELDMSIYAWNDRRDYGAEIPDEVIKLQANRYRELFEAFKANKDLLKGVVFWGIADDHTWLSSFPMKRTEAPLLFDQQLHAKPAFWAIVDPSRQPE